MRDADRGVRGAGRPRVPDPPTRARRSSDPRSAGRDAGSPCHQRLERRPPSHGPPPAAGSRRRAAAAAAGGRRQHASRSGRQPDPGIEQFTRAAGGRSAAPRACTRSARLSASGAVTGVRQRLAGVHARTRGSSWRSPSRGRRRATPIPTALDAAQRIDLAAGIAAFSAGSRLDQPRR